MQLSKFISSELILGVSDKSIKAIRSGFRAVLKDDVGGYSLGKHISGQLPYYYRKLDSVLEDFQAGHSALEAMLDLMATAPTTKKFRDSHCGEILASHFLEERLGLRRLYSKLTMTTSEDTNAHKMDALFVDTRTEPYQYIFVEAKSSIQPTSDKASVSHKSGLLKKMIDSLNRYSEESPRFELVRIRENLDSSFEPTERRIILSDLRPPGPDLRFIGISVTNASTISQSDDDFVLTADCQCEFDYRALVVTDLSKLADTAYGYWDTVKGAVEGGDV